MDSNVNFVSFDGTSLNGSYRKVPNQADTVAILVHGINSSRDELGLFSGLADSLDGVGIPTFRFDYRCHGVNNKPIESLTLSGVVNDIEAAARAALEQSGASKVHVVGMSFGGGLAAFWASWTDLKVISVVMMAPVIDYMEDVLGQHGAIVNGKLDAKSAESLVKNGYLEMDYIRYGGALLNELPFISGIAGIQRLKCPSLIIHGDADSIVPYSSSEKFSKLRDDCRMVNIPGTDHGFGVEGDEDLSFPETKEKHRNVFRIVSDFYEGIAGR